MRIFNDKKPSIRVLIPGFFYACLVLYIGYGAVWQGLSHYFADSAFRSGSEIDAEAAINYLPENPEAYETLGEIYLRNKEYQLASDTFHRAIAYRKNDFLLWLRLGYSLSRAGNLNAAEAAYQKAIELAPNYSQPNYFMGTMLLEVGRNDDAFQYLSRAADRDQELYPHMLHRARLAYSNDPLLIENSFQPTTHVAKKIVARYLIKHNGMTETVRSFLTSDELDDGEKNEFIQYLLHKENFEVAREVWLSRLKRESGVVGETIFDGGFEAITENDPSGLGWQIDQRINSTGVARSSRNVRSGAYALQIKFAGDVELGRNIVSQLVHVDPGRKYTLHVSVFSSELISAGLPTATITSVFTNELLAKTSEIQATGGKWVEYTCEFTASDSVVRIGFQRLGCVNSPCPIFGELFLDDLFLVEK